MFLSQFFNFLRIYEYVIYSFVRITGGQFIECNLLFQRTFALYFIRKFLISRKIIQSNDIVYKIDRSDQYCKYKDVYVRLNDVHELYTVLYPNAENYLFLLIPILFSHFDGIILNLTHTCDIVVQNISFKNLFTYCTVTELFASEFDFNDNSFKSFVEYTQFNCERLLVLDIKKCVLNLDDMITINKFTNLKELHLPVDANNSNSLIDFFYFDTTLSKSLEIFICHKISKEEYKLQKSFVKLKYDDIRPKVDFYYSDSDILEFKDQLTQVIVEYDNEINEGNRNILNLSSFTNLKEITFK